MTDATPPVGKRTVLRPPDASAPSGAAGGAALLVATRIGLWVGIQLLVAGLLVLAGAEATGGQAVNAAASWWMVYSALVDLGTLGLIGWQLQRRGSSYRRLLGPPAAGWQIALGALGVLAATVPAVVFSNELTAQLYGGDATPPMFAVFDVPPLASVFSFLWCRCWPN